MKCASQPESRWWETPDQPAHVPCAVGDHTACWPTEVWAIGDPGYGERGASRPSEDMVRIWGSVDPAGWRARTIVLDANAAGNVYLGAL